MKKFLILLLVLGLSSAASATTVSLMDPGVAVGDVTATRIYLAVDMTGLQQLSVTITAVGDATITGGVMAAEAFDFGLQATDYVAVVVTAGGWQNGLSLDTAVTGGTMAEIGLGHFGSTIYGATTDPAVAMPIAAGSLGSGVIVNTPIAYIDVIATGMGSVTLTMVDGSQFGANTLDEGGPIAGFGNPLTLDTVPEPMTIALLGLGGLALLRRRR